MVRTQERILAHGQAIERIACPVTHGRKGHDMSVASRLLIIAASLLLSLTYFFPLWEISLEAPQYPEGLGLEIWINQMQGQNPGDLGKINNLNHYIGMKTIHPESIKELTVMPWVMRGLMLFGLVVALIGRRRLLAAWLVLFVIVAAAGFVDFYLWGHDYGHNLDMENAIIKVPGMTYQPPLIGSKQLLNFTAHSWPGTAGWVAVGVFVISAVIYLWERMRLARTVKEVSHAL
jgi:copper chaperone NosL